MEVSRIHGMYLYYSLDCICVISLIIETVIDYNIYNVVTGRYRSDRFCVISIELLMDYLCFVLTLMLHTS